MAHFQQDGHMAMQNPVGRTNYEPNSRTGAERGPREDPANGFQTFPEEMDGPKRRVRAESFADHYSQAGQFFRSQTAVEQQHIVEAFTFELSKVHELAIRERMVANLRNVDDDLAGSIAAHLGMAALPAPSRPAADPDPTLPPSPALSILANGPESFTGRKLGILATDGAPAAVITALRSAMKAEGASIEVIAPVIAGVTLDDGTVLPADQMVGGGPSVLYDAVAVVVSADGAAKLSLLPAAKDFVADAHAHHKFVAYVPDAVPLLTAAGVTEVDAGYVKVGSRSTATRFGKACRSLRFWERSV
jgi:catalase